MTQFPLVSALGRCRGSSSAVYDDANSAKRQQAGLAARAAAVGRRPRWRERPPIVAAPTTTAGFTAGDRIGTGTLRGIIYLTAFCQEALRFCDRRRDGILTEARRQFSQSRPEKGSLSIQHEAAIDAVIGASMWELRRRRVHSSEPSSGPSPSRMLPKHRISHGQGRFWPS